MKAKFRRDEPICGEESAPTKKDLRELYKREHAKLVKYEAHMVMLGEMYDSYEYEQNSLNQMVGICYILATRTKDRMADLKKRIKHARAN